MNSKFLTIFENVMRQITIKESTDIIASHDKVVIDPKQLAKQKEDISTKKSPSYYTQLEKLANDKEILTISSIKRVNRPTANLVDGASHTFQEEADVVRQYNPGNYFAPMSVPLSLLVKIADYNGSFNLPVNGRKEANLKSEVHSDYNSGKQPRGTITNGGNN